MNSRERSIVENEIVKILQLFVGTKIPVATVEIETARELGEDVSFAAGNVKVEAYKHAGNIYVSEIQVVDQTLNGCKVKGIGCYVQ